MVIMKWRNLLDHSFQNYLVQLPHLKTVKLRRFENLSTSTESADWRKIKYKISFVLTFNTMSLVSIIGSKVL